MCTSVSNDQWKSYVFSLAQKYLTVADALIKRHDASRVNQPKPTWALMRPSIDAYRSLMEAGAGVGVISFSMARPIVAFIADTTAGTSR